MVKNLKEIKIQVEVLVDSVMKNEVKFNPVVLQQSLDDYDSSAEFIRLYLKKNKEGYHVYCLGKSGEAKKGIQVRLRFKKKYKSDDDDEYFLVTNEQGCVKIG